MVCERMDELGMLNKANGKLASYGKLVEKKRNAA